MPATYNPNLPTDRDWVRFLTGDTDVAGAALLDEEIDAVVAAEVARNGAGEWTKYCAAAEALAAMAAGWASAGMSTDWVEKTVGKLSLRRAEGQSARDAVDARVRELRARCAWLLTSRPRAFRMAGSRY